MLAGDAGPLDHRGKMFFTEDTESITSITYVYQFPLHPESHRGEWTHLNGCCTCSGFVLQLRNPEFRGMQPFMIVCKETLLTISQRAALSLFYWTVNKPTHLL